MSFSVIAHPHTLLRKELKNNHIRFLINFFIFGPDITSFFSGTICTGISTLTMTSKQTFMKNTILY